MAMGSIAGYYGGRIDQIISRVMDVLLAFPGLLLAIALVAVLGPSLENVVLALTVIGWVGYARLVRGQVLRAREFEYVVAARALGAGTLRTLTRHVLPTALPAVTVQATLGMAAAILSEAALSFLGLGGAATDTQLGDDDQRRSIAPAGRAAFDDLPRVVSGVGGARVQLPGRRPPRSPRSPHRIASLVSRSES